MRALVIVCLAIAVAGCGESGAPDSGPAASDAPGQAASRADADRMEHGEATAAEHAGDSPERSPLVEPVDVPLLEQELAYGETEGANLTGFLAMPRDAIDPPPGVLVIHEWWGLNDNIKAMTRRLAAEGYIALAVDLYGDAVADDPERAEELMTDAVSAPETVRSNLRQAHEYLSEHALSPRTGVIGWCLGGGWSLQAALMLPAELDAMVMYYGQLETSEQRLRELSTPMLGLFGELDESIPAPDVRRFRSRLREMGKDADIHIYPGVGHAFANPSGGNYDARAAEDAWNRTLEFLDRHLK